MKEKIKLGVMSAFAAVALAGAPALATTDNNTGNDNPHNDVTLCHATGSQSNPYVQITVNANGAVSGHAGDSHQDGRDIIPPFEYKEGDMNKSFPGQNWDTQGQTIHRNDCHAGGQGGTTVTNTTTNNTTTNNVTQQVAGRGAQAPAKHHATPQAVAAHGGVSAGAGGAESYSTGAIVGLLGSVGAIMAGAARFVTSKQLF